MTAAALDRNLALDAARVAEAAAIASHPLVGCGDEKAADQAAVDAMRTALNALPIAGRIVIGEGERDEAPMLYIGEAVGTGEGQAIDIAVDGGIDPRTAGLVAAAGANRLVAGSAVFRDGPAGYRANMDAIRRAALTARGEMA